MLEGRRRGFEEDEELAGVRRLAQVVAHDRTGGVSKLLPRSQDLTARRILRPGRRSSRQRGLVSDAQDDSGAEFQLHGEGAHRVRGRRRRGEGQVYPFWRRLGHASRRSAVMTARDTRRPVKRPARRPRFRGIPHFGRHGLHGCGGWSIPWRKVFWRRQASFSRAKAGAFQPIVQLNVDPSIPAAPAPFRCILLLCDFPIVA